MRDATKELLTGLESMYGTDNVMYVKGIFLRRIPGHESERITIAQARKLTGIQAPKRTPRQRVQPWGEYAWIAALNGMSTDNA